MTSMRYVSFAFDSGACIVVNASLEKKENCLPGF
jgi:hypothetical protein